MNKQQIYDYLQENSIWHEITEHKAVYNMAELAESAGAARFDSGRSDTTRGTER